MTDPAFVVVDVVPDTEEWMEERRASLGASELAAVLGVSRWEDDTPLRVFESKQGKDRDFPEELAFIGHQQESLMEAWLRRFHPEVGEIQPAAMLRSVKYPWLHASLDRWAVDESGQRAPVQMKTGMAFSAKEWKDGVPEDVQVQVQGEMLVSGAPFAWVVAFIGGRTFYLHKVARDRKVQAQIVKYAGGWWRKHPAKGIPPLPSNYDEARAVYPGVIGKAFALDDEMFANLEQRDVDSADMYHLKKRLDVFKEYVALEVGDATVLTYRGEPVYTYKRQLGTRQIDLDLLQEKHPRIYAAMVTQPSYPQLRRIKKKKESDDASSDE